MSAKRWRRRWFTRTQQALERLWYSDSTTLWLAPFGGAYGGLMRLRHHLYQRRILSPVALGCPVIVVGNLSVGGSGKTPLVITIAGWLKHHGLRPGIVCRGYRGQARSWPQRVTPASSPAAVGDEAVLLAEQTGCAVAAAPDRVAAAQMLIAECRVNVIISDDGLQHLRLPRDVEIVVVDALRGFGNRRCLPAGPLREPCERLNTVDLIVNCTVDGTATATANEDGGMMRMILQPQDAVALRAPHQRRALSAFKGRPVHAVCGIGNPQRFFATLRGVGLTIIEHPFPDHHWFSADDIGFGDDRPVLMSAKDAVKCRAFATAEHWSVGLTTRVDPRVKAHVLAILERHQHCAAVPPGC